MNTNSMYIFSIHNTGPFEQNTGQDRIAILLKFASHLSETSAICLPCMGIPFSPFPTIVSKSIIIGNSDAKISSNG